jgi:hypothetical protein
VTFVLIVSGREKSLLVPGDDAVEISQRRPVQMSAQSAAQFSLAVIVKACMSCGSVVAVLNPVQNITVSVWFISYHLAISTSSRQSISNSETNT